MKELSKRPEGPQQTNEARFYCVSFLRSGDIGPGRPVSTRFGLRAHFPFFLTSRAAILFPWRTLQQV